jgi:lysozyme family protein
LSPLEELVARVIAREGGIADVGDGKGLTRFGQTPAWLEQFGLPIPETPADAADNYMAWIAKVGLTSVVMQGDDLADILLDVAVMSSATKAVKLLQAALGVTVDGKLGPVTLAALFTADRAQIARDAIAADMEYQGRLIELDPTRSRYAAGWAARMAGHVRRLS